MSKASPAVTAIARQLLTSEPSGIEGAMSVCEQLRAPLTLLTGAGGCASLVSRALAVAKTECVALRSWRVRNDGALVRLAPSAPEEDADGGLIFVAHLLALLIRFVGEAVTVRLIQNTWPERTFTLEAFGS